MYSLTLRLDVCIRAWCWVLAFVWAKYPEYHRLIDLGIQLWHSGSISSDPSRRQKTPGPIWSVCAQHCRGIQDSIPVCDRNERRPSHPRSRQEVSPARGLRNDGGADSPPPLLLSSGRRHPPPRRDPFPFFPSWWRRPSHLSLLCRYGTGWFKLRRPACLHPELHRAT